MCAVGDDHQQGQHGSARIRQESRGHRVRGVAVPHARAGLGPGPNGNEHGRPGQVSVQFDITNINVLESCNWVSDVPVCVLLCCCSSDVLASSAPSSTAAPNPLASTFTLRLRRAEAKDCDSLAELIKEFAAFQSEASRAEVYSPVAVLCVCVSNFMCSVPTNSRALARGWLWHRPQVSGSISRFSFPVCCLCLCCWLLFLYSRSPISVLHMHTHRPSSLMSTARQWPTLSAYGFTRPHTHTRAHFTFRTCL